MCLLPYSLPLIALALLIFVVVLYMDAGDRKIRRSLAASDLSKLSLRVTGDPLDTFSLGGRHGGMELELSSNRSAPLPGPSGREQNVCLITFDVNVPDFVCCRRSDRDAVMGALPAVPELRTGHQAFDEVYAVFSRDAETDDAAGFRTAPDRAPRWWVPAPVLEQLTELGLEWARVQQGRAELAIKPVHSGMAARALVAARNLASPATEAAAPLPPQRPARSGGASPVRPCWSADAGRCSVRFLRRSLCLRRRSWVPCARRKYAVPVGRLCSPRLATPTMSSAAPARIARRPGTL